MQDLIEDDEPGGNAPEFTVSEISGAVKRVVEGEFGRIRVRGEVGRVSRPRSGHIYLDLKDDRAVLSAVVWKGVSARLQHQPEEGLEVIAEGRLTTFPGQSKYQMIVDDIRPAGAGALMAMLEKRKAQLQAEGLFDAARKRPLPYLPEIIGVVTSPSGAVIRDILHRLRDRFPRKVLIWPVAVQGDRCAPEVAAAIRGFNALAPGGPVPRPDLLIVARGGGSIEDLWGFNEEIVVRAAADSAIPLISAVGHETDTTLIDYAADRRAPTPTAAAELAVPVRAELQAWADRMEARMIRAAGLAVERRQQRLADVSRLLPRPEALLADARQRLDRAEDALPRALVRLTERAVASLARTSALLRPALLTARIRDERRRLDVPGQRLAPALLRLVARNRERSASLAARLRPEPLHDRISRGQDMLDRAAPRLDAVVSGRLRAMSDRLAALDRLRLGLGYEATLKRGYAVVRSGDEVLTRAAEAERARHLQIEFADGKVAAETSAAPPPRPKRKPEGPDQGSLF